jgi:phage tail P2-like protein
MINFYESQIIDILPENLKTAPDVQALSYAVMKANQKLQSYALRTMIYAAIQEMPNNILDTLAIELRTQYYRQDMDLETKRQVIQETIQWYIYAGTPYAVEKLITAVFKTGEVVEWFDYGGEPGHFKITTENHNITGDALVTFNSIIERVKRKSSILDTVEITLSAYMSTYYGAVLHTGDYISIRQEG